MGRIISQPIRKPVDTLPTIKNLLKTILFKRTPVAAVVLLLLSGVAQASNWWSDDWAYRKKITLDTTPTGVAIPDSIGTAPVLIRLHAGNFQFAAAKEDGSDIRFVADDNKTLLPHQIEKYDALLGEAFLWVKVPDVKPGAKTSFWLYCGNGSSKLEAGSDAKSPYDPETVLVYHFNEHATPATDSSGAGNLAQTAGIAADGSFIGSGIRLDEKTAITIPAAPSLRWLEADPITISTWIKLATLPANEIVFSRREGDTNLVVGIENGALYVEIARAGAVQRSPLGSPLTAGSWHHVAVVSAQATINLYLDGETIASLHASLPSLNSALQSGGENFSGELDEFQTVGIFATSRDVFEF